MSEVPITPSLRREAEALVEWFYRFAHVGEDAQIAKVEAFAKAQRREGYNEAMKDQREELRDAANEQSWKDKQGEDYGSY